MIDPEPVRCGCEVGEEPGQRAGGQLRRRDAPVEFAEDFTGDTFFAVVITPEIKPSRLVEHERRGRFRDERPELRAAEHGEPAVKPGEREPVLPFAELLPGPEFEAAAAVSFAHRARDECGGGGKLGSQRSAGEPFEEVREYGVDRFEAFDCGEMNPAHPISSSSWRTSSYGGLS